MKARTISRTTAVFFLVALALIVGGLLCGAQSFAQFEEVTRSRESYEAMLEAIRLTAVFTMISGSMVVVGIGILVIQFLHLIRRTTRIQKEAEALRAKNEAMEAVYQQTQRLAHHQRLETIGTLTASIAHEFNNLLTPIMGYSLMALEKLPPEEEALYDEILEIYNASRKAKNIISRLNDLSRKNTETAFRQVSPDDLIRKTLDVANPAKPPEVELKLDLNCWDQRIHANEIQISQMLLNLILNGFHAMGEKGVLTIGTSFDENNIQIRVQDTGCGIPDKIRKRIFEPFFTTKEAGKGTGLGLAIVAQVVEDHQGRIKVDSKTGEGTTFTIRLPRVPQSVESDPN